MYLRVFNNYLLKTLANNDLCLKYGRRNHVFRKSFNWLLTIYHDISRWKLILKKEYLGTWLGWQEFNSSYLSRKCIVHCNHNATFACFVNKWLKEKILTQRANSEFITKTFHTLYSDVSDPREKLFLAAPRDGRRSVGLWWTPKHPAAREEKPLVPGLFLFSLTGSRDKDDKCPKIFHKLQ